MKEQYAWVACVIGVSLIGCKNQGLVADSTARAPAAEASGVSQTPSEEVMLAGDFERVSRATTGRAEIVRRGMAYELVLTGVNVATDSTARVYLVGHDRASSTFLVDSAEVKYDMAALERGRERQVIALPSEPDPKLRSVVLYNPEFGINLGFAPLRGRGVLPPRH